MAWYDGILSFLGILPKDLKLEDIPLDFNYNNYDPMSPVIIKNKKILKEQLRRKYINYKQYSAACTAMKRGWKNKSLLDVPVEEFNDKTFKGSNFAQQEPFTDMFPSGIINCTLERCNVINCNIPAGITLIDCQHKQIKVQNDGEYWEVDAAMKPLQPLSPQRYDLFGLSKNPLDLPSKPLTENIILTAQKEKEKQDRKDMLIDVVNDPVKLQQIIDKEELI